MYSNERLYLAHSKNSTGMVQLMKEHSMGVGRLMRNFALSDSFADLYEYCGLIHDIGKYTDKFQQYIIGQHNNKVRHSIYGGIFSYEKKQVEVALPVYGHHTGLPNLPEMVQNIKAEKNANSKLFQSIINTWKDDGDVETVEPSERAFFNIQDILQQELFIRMLFSSLVDADSLDTERHFRKDAFIKRQRESLNVDLLLEKLQKRFMQFASNSGKMGLAINILRNDVRAYAETKATLPQGFFSLTLPTGLGKTLCSVSWALHHAKYHPNIKRIIIVLPFISIIDQTAEELKGIFNDRANDYVLEHHSNVIYQEFENNDEINPKQLATENWDYPIVVTTAVQFFESLFSNNRSMCRKLHNIQDSVVIFDEIQTLPLHITEPTLTMLSNLQQLCRCSMLFCTATQPDFVTRQGFSGIDHIESLVKDPKHIFDQTRRVIYHPLNGYEELTISELSDCVLKNHRSALVVFNTKKKALKFYESLGKVDGFKVFHLSTNMCPAHRKEVLKAIRKALLDDELIIVSSTQLIEAGVDLDFPNVYREMAPLESIIQSAGRCNREGQLKDENGELKFGDVYLFALTEYGQPSKQYRSWSEFANLLYKGYEDRLYTHDFYGDYYRKLVKLFGQTDRLNITEDRKRLLFKDVADKYKVIDNKATSVFVYNYSDASRELYYRIKDKEYLTRADRQLVGQYCVQLYNIEEFSNLCTTEKCGIYVWHGDYSKECGIINNGDINLIV